MPNMEEITQVNATSGQESPNPDQEVNQILDQNADQNLNQNADQNIDQNQAPTHVVKWKRPYKFEGEEYTEVDLSGLDHLTIQDAIAIQKQLFSSGKEVAGSLLSETTMAFACAVATKATGMPIEFFKLMPRGAGRRLQRTIFKYLNVDHTVENGTMTLCEPYCFDGKIYKEIDLSGLEDLTALQETAAENAIAKDGFIISENSFNYLYACVVAAMATGLPEEFFTGLPLRELMKLRLAVVKDSFFELE